MVYYVIALTLYMQVSYREVLRCLLEGLEWMAGPARALKVTGRSGISQARTRLGWRPLQQLYDELVGPIAGPATQGAWYRGWRLMSLDGSTLDVPDTAANAQAFYHERWEIETALDELKTHLRGATIVLRSKTPDLVRQEFYGLLLAHFAIRGLMHEAAVKVGIDPDRLSFVHAVRVIRRKLPRAVAIPPSGPASLP